MLADSLRRVTVERLALKAFVEDPLEALARGNAKSVRSTRGRLHSLVPHGLGEIEEPHGASKRLLLGGAQILFGIA